MDEQEAAIIVFSITFSILIGGTAFLFIREQLLSRERARILHHNPEFSDYRFCVNCRQRLPKTSGKRFFFSSFLMFEARNRAEENRIAADCNIKDAVCYLHSHPGDWRALALAVASNYYATPSRIDKLVETFPKLSAERVTHNLIRLHLRGKRTNIDIATFIIKFQVESCVLPAAEAIMFGESHEDSKRYFLHRLSVTFPNVLTTAKMNELVTGVVL